MNHPLNFNNKEALTKIEEERGTSPSSLVSFRSDESLACPPSVNEEEALINQNIPEVQTGQEKMVSEETVSKDNNEMSSSISLLQMSIKKKFESIYKEGLSVSLSQIYTELYITEGRPAEVNREHEIRRLERAFRKSDRPETTIKPEDVCKPPPGRSRPIRTVITMGIAGIGKTVLTNKFALDWAEGKTNQDIQFLFLFSFRELNLLKEEKFSLEELIHHFYSETKSFNHFEEFKVLFIFDGLDECRFPLNLNSTEILTDVTQPASLGVLLTNLIKGKLLPSAQLWITTRPAAANQIPPECVDMVTEVRGFNDSQKEEYFRKRFREDEDQAITVYSQIKKCRSLHIMCHIPVFCWISATVLDELLKREEQRETPRSLTEMYIHFVLIHIQNIKYDGGSETDSVWNPQTRNMILSLGKLAFEQLQKGNLFFYESDLTESGIDVRAASVCSGVFTQIFNEESGLHQSRVFCFVHLSVQEFLAALYVHLTFFQTGTNLLLEKQPGPGWIDWLRGKRNGTLLYQSAVDKALQSPNGHLDLFLRFLLGLSLSSQVLLRGPLKQKGPNSNVILETVQHIKKKLNEQKSVEKSINLLHCLEELQDRSLIEEINQSLTSGSLSPNEMSTSQWSALVFILLSSEENLEEFDLKKYFASDVSLQNLLPVIKESNRAALNCCNLSEMSCEILASVLISRSLEDLKDLDLSNNDLKDSGLKWLCEGLQSPHCKLETLRLSGCLITKTGVNYLVKALDSNHSHLKELDLSFNHLGDSEVEVLSDGLKDPTWALNILKMRAQGANFMEPGLKKYAVDLTLDENTVHKNLILRNNNKTVMIEKKKQKYPDHPERFDDSKQVLCTEGLTGRCYWEVEWKGKVYIAVTYRGIKKKTKKNKRVLGKNEISWSLLCSDESHSVLHNNISTAVPGVPSHRVGVYLDSDAGTLSFFKVCLDKVIHLHTFKATFSEPVYPAFRVRTEPFNSSLTLC